MAALRRAFLARKIGRSLLCGWGAVLYTAGMVVTQKPPRLRWYQFSLRSLCVMMALACVGMSWVGVKVQRARRQREIVEEIEGLGGVVAYDYEFSDAPPGPEWLRKRLGNDCFATVVFVSLCNTQVTDAHLEHIKGLSELQTLWLSNTQISNRGIKPLKELTQLEELFLDDTQVSDEGINELNEALPNCGIVYSVDRRSSKRPHGDEGHRN